MSDPNDWHVIKKSMYEVNDLWEQAETESAKAHIEDAVLHLKQAYRAELKNND